MSFTDLADQRRLAAARAQLAELPWDVVPDAYQRLRVPSTAEAEPLLRLMTRRALEPKVVSILLDRFADRPLERALIAWDVAAGSLLGTDDGELEQRVARELAPLKQLGAAGPFAIPRDRVGALIEAARSCGVPADSDALPSLAAVVALADSGVAITEGERVLDAVLAFAKRLELAHLPSLALSFLHLLWDRFALPRALDLLVEIALDHDLRGAIPVLSGEDDRSIQRQAYFAMRAHLLEHDVGGAQRWVEALSTHPALRDASDPALTVAAAELALLADEVPDRAGVDAIEKLADADRTWRYAARVCASMKLRLSPEDAASTVEGFLTSFGNDMRLWALASYPERPELLPLLARELRYASHDPEVWRGVASFIDGGEAVYVELEQRLSTQLERALAAASSVTPPEPPAPFEWPEFTTNQPLDDGRSWTATFDSYDQYHEVYYYRVRVLYEQRWSDEFMVSMGMGFAGDDWRVPEFTTMVREQIASVAATGKTNTTYSR